MLIYALIDPRTNERRYIGKTMRTARRRLRRHLARCYLDDADTHKNRWLRTLLAAGLEPMIEVLETCTSATALSAAERRHIAEHLARGVRLTNHTLGGDGGSGKHTDASKAKIRAALKGKPKTAEHRARVSAGQRGRVTSLETRRKLSAAQKARVRRPVTRETRVRISRAKGGKPFEDQHGRRYETQKGAARALGINVAHINDVLHGKRKSAGGLVFRFLRVREFPDAVARAA